MMNRLFEVRIPKQVSFTEWEIYKVEAISEDDAIDKAKSGNYIGEIEYEDAGDYETMSVDYSETEIEEITKCK
jgi:hypothetical protein